MWVRIDEISFPADRADDVIDDVRNHAVSRHDGDGFRGFRLLVDRAHGRALDVSYWDGQNGALAGESDPEMNPTRMAAPTVIRSEVYELSIDAT